MYVSSWCKEDRHDRWTACCSLSSLSFVNPTPTRAGPRTSKSWRTEEGLSRSRRQPSVLEGCNSRRTTEAFNSAFCRRPNLTSKDHACLEDPGKGREKKKVSQSCASHEHAKTSWRCFFETLCALRYKFQCAMWQA